MKKILKEQALARLERNLIQRLADELTNAIRIIYNEDGTQHISTATPVLDEARAYLAQSETEEPTDEELEEFARNYRAALDSNYRAVLALWGRRPNPPSLKQQALARLEFLETLAQAFGHDPDDTIRRALEDN